MSDPTHKGHNPSIIWMPGVRMFRSMSFLSKAAAIFAVFMLVVAQLSFIYVRSTNQVIQASQSEQLGVSVVKSLAQLIEQAHKLRRLAVEAEGKGSPAVAEQLAAVDRQLTQTESLSTMQSAAMQEAFKFARDAYTPLKSASVDREETFTRHDEFIQQVLRLMAAVADLTSLSQDPDPDSYHLMLASTQETPRTLHMLGRLRELGSDAIAAGSLNSHQRRILQGDSYVMYTQIELLFARYERAVKANPALGATLNFEEAFKPVNAFMRTVRRGPLAESGPTGNARAYSDAGEAAIASLSALSTRSYDSLTSLIEARMATQQRARNVQLCLVLLGLLVTAYFFYCFYVVTRDGMEAVMRYIHAIAQGDLSVTPRPTGKDEAASLMVSIIRMLEALRQLVGQVRGCAQVIVQTSAQVSAGAQDLAGRTDQAGRCLQETAATMEQIASAVKHTAEKTNESAQLGRANAEAAGEGGEVVSRMVATMEDIKSSSGKIGEIIGVIDSIAFQTNILALNAAVEAARAGEQGRGFAVVAGEVRALAQRSASAAREIKNLVSTSADQTDAGDRIVRDAGQTMNALVRNAVTMSDLLAGVSTATDEQQRGIGDVSTAMARLDEDTRSNTTLVEQTNRAALSMKQLASELAAAADRFRLP